jgi:hypothetical protein
VKRLARILMAVVPIFLLLPAWARAQTGFACPKAGTIVDSAGGKYVYAGPEPGDPAVCRVNSPDGRHLRRPYSWYGEEALTPGGDRSARPALQALFSGDRSEVTFDLMTIQLGKVSDTWRRSGRETLMLGGHQSVDTIVYQHENFFYAGRQGLWSEV